MQICIPRTDIETPTSMRGDNESAGSNSISEIKKHENDKNGVDAQVVDAQVVDAQVVDAQVVDAQVVEEDSNDDDSDDDASDDEDGVYDTEDYWDQEEHDYLKWCIAETNIPALIAAYDKKPSDNFSGEDLYALEEMKKIYKRTGKLGSAWNWNCLLGRRTFEQNKKLWNLAEKNSIGEKLIGFYVEARSQREWEDRVALIKRCWWKTDLQQDRGGSFARNEEELLSRSDHMVYLNVMQIADNDCMGLHRNPKKWWTKFPRS